MLLNLAVEKIFTLSCETSLQSWILFIVAKSRVKFPANSGHPLQVNTVVPSWFLNKSYFGLRTLQRWLYHLCLHHKDSKTHFNVSKKTE